MRFRPWTDSHGVSEPWSDSHGVSVPSVPSIPLFRDSSLSSLERDFAPTGTGPQGAGGLGRAGSDYACRTVPDLSPMGERSGTVGSAWVKGQER